MPKASAKLNSKGVQSVLKGGKGAEGVRAAVQRSVSGIAAAAGPGHTTRLSTGRTRVRGTVTTSSSAARRKEAETRNLTRAVDGGRQ